MASEGGGFFAEKWQDIREMSRNGEKTVGEKKSERKSQKETAIERQRVRLDRKSTRNVAFE